MVEFPTGARGVERLIAETVPKRQYALKIVTYAPCPTCGFDEFTRAARQIDCVTCGGTGRVRTERVSYVSGYARWITGITLFLTRGVAMSGEIGDCLFTTDIRNRPILEEAVNAEEAWLVIDGQRVKPRTLQAMHVGGTATSLTAYCSLVREEA